MNSVAYTDQGPVEDPSLRKFIGKLKENAMQTSRKISESASIVIVGSFNPRIFHPEWLISKNIVERWDYQSLDLACVSDFARVNLAGNSFLQAFPDQFVVQSSMASEFPALQDTAINIFKLLRETPVFQIGLNYNLNARLASLDEWKAFGNRLVNSIPWKGTAKYLTAFDSFPPEKQGLFGLVHETFQLPRPDEHAGHIRCQITTVNALSFEVSVLINNHIELTGDRMSMLLSSIETSWDPSLELASEIIENLFKKEQDE